MTDPLPTASPVVMPPTPVPGRGYDPCMQIQVDLSAMLDGELDAPSVRRVMVHSDACASCRGFLEGIRSQVRLHRELIGAGVDGVDGVGVGVDGPRLGDGSQNDGEVGGADHGNGSAGTVAAGAGGAGSNGEPDGAVLDGAASLRRQLTDNRKKLSKILYELGRCFVLMGLSPDFSKVVSKEPVPMPDMATRGRNLLDEVARSESGAPADWVAAKDLFDGRWCSPNESLAKGQRLLTECLGLDPESFESRIYLGLVHHVRGQRTLAKKQFTLVLAGTADRVMRGYALLNLGNLHLDEGDCDGAAELLHEVVASGVVEQQPRLGMAYFNLGLAYGLKGEFDESLRWFQRLHDELPHRRAVIAKELRRRSQFLHIVRSHPGIQGRFAERLPAWFAEAG
ncbi:MAG: tetratricopeptide repeat protein [Planctomycetes bacterium]|nr:tetratricopeptide repeat protein [Planctomycetota bacterium]